MKRRRAWLEQVGQASAKPERMRGVAAVRWLWVRRYRRRDAQHKRCCCPMHAVWWAPAPRVVGERGAARRHTKGEIEGRVSRRQTSRQTGRQASHPCIPDPSPPPDPGRTDPGGAPPVGVFLLVPGLPMLRMASLEPLPARLFWPTCTSASASWYRLRASSVSWSLAARRKAHSSAWSTSPWALLSSYSSWSRAQSACRGAREGGNPGRAEVGQREGAGCVCVKRRSTGGDLKGPK